MRPTESVRPYHGQMMRIWEEKEMKEMRRRVPATLRGSAGRSGTEAHAADQTRSRVRVTMMDAQEARRRVRSEVGSVEE